MGWRTVLRVAGEENGDNLPKKGETARKILTFKPSLAIILIGMVKLTGGQ